MPNRTSLLTLNRVLQFLFLAAICLMLLACGGGTNSNNGGGGGGIANIDGAWEFVVTSTANPAWTTYVEQEFQNQAGGNATGSGMVFMVNRGAGEWGPGCDELALSAYTKATISGTTITGTFTETANSMFDFTGTLPSSQRACTCTARSR